MPPDRLLPSRWTSPWSIVLIALGTALAAVAVTTVLGWYPYMTVTAILLTAAVSGFLRQWALRLIIVAGAGGLALTLVTIPPGADLAEGIMGGLIISLLVAVPAVVVNLVRQRRAFVQRGWDLADAEARSRGTGVQEAIRRERTAIAAEIHDGLGHQLTLIAVQVGRLSLDTDLPSATRAELREIRGSAAQAAEQLGGTVRLLRDPETDGPPESSGTVDEAIKRARAAGIVVDDEIPEDFHARLSPSASHAVTRFVQEGLGNAARHAPGTTVALRTDEDGPNLRVTMTNPLVTTEPQPERTGGFGLLGLRHRAALLGGRLSTGTDDQQFWVTLEIPTDAEQEVVPWPADEVSEQRLAADADRTEARRTAVFVPALLMGALALTAAVYFLLTTLMGVLPVSDFEQIAPGDDQARVEQLLPPLQMLDPPLVEFSEPAASTCRYYEAAISYFERLDVHVVCFRDGHVVQTEVIPAP